MKATGYITIKVDLELSGDALTDAEVVHEFMNELDYKVESNTKGVAVVDTELTAYEIEEGDE